MSVRDLMYLVFALAIVNGLIAAAILQSFLSGTKAIANAKDLAKFKSMVRPQMYQALVQMILLYGGMLLGIYGILTGKIGLGLVLILNGLVLVMGLSLKKVEEKARSLKVEDPALENEYKRICFSWLKKPFPDF